MATPFTKKTKNKKQKGHSRVWQRSGGKKKRLRPTSKLLKSIYLKMYPQKSLFFNAIFFFVWGRLTQEWPISSCKMKTDFFGQVNFGFKRCWN